MLKRYYVFIADFLYSYKNDYLTTLQIEAS
jgi:hypothetical protein